MVNLVKSEDIVRDLVSRLPTCHKMKTITMKVSDHESPMTRVVMRKYVEALKAKGLYMFARLYAHHGTVVITIRKASDRERIVNGLD